MCARSHSCSASCASPRRSARITTSCSSWARLANPRRKRKRSMPITTAATEPSTMMTIVIPPACSSSFSSPELPRATVLGHEGRLVSGELAGVPVLAQQGRLHGYEGHDAATVAFPARVLGVLGARALVLTNAAGGLNPHLQPGDLMRITDHINLTARNPLVGP